eukprot:PLAT3615.4.p1 GENE.PLAT3615.4~~PLAT3615.4.p1  ORF type:complete len:488 (-),score=234.70 PLAT3615.4:215-1678(-)
MARFASSALLLLALAAGTAFAGSIRAGVVKVDATLPIGVPLAGFSARHDKLWPFPKLRLGKNRYTTWMQPSIGAWQPTWVKALVIDDGEGTRIAHLTMDAIGSDGGTVKNGWKQAHALGFTVPEEQTLFHASHTHSGPGAVSYEKLWQIAPATDLYIPGLQDQFGAKIAEALVTAEKQLQPVRLGFGMGKMYNVTHNRRANESPYVEPWSIDPYTGIFRVDTLDGQPLATVWNFAIHGTCLSPANLKLSGDIMGVSNDEIETSIGGISMFINADAGDIAPDGSTVCGHDVDVTHSFPGRYIIAKHIADFREATETFTEGKVTYAQFDMDFGMTNLNLTSDRLAMLGVCSADARRHSMNLCEMCAMLNCDVEVAMDGTWVENTPRFTALHWEIGGEEKIMVTIPGEALEELGKEIRSDAKELGFDTDNTFLLGYSQNHMGYFTTPNEYLVGGYESLLSFWGIETGEKVRFGCRNAMKKVMGVALEEEK